MRGIEEERERVREVERYGEGIGGRRGRQGRFFDSCCNDIISDSVLSCPVLSKLFRNHVQ